MALFFNIAEGIIRIALSIKGGNIVDCVRLNAGDEIIRILLMAVMLSLMIFFCIVFKESLYARSLEAEVFRLKQNTFDNLVKIPLQDLESTSIDEKVAEKLNDINALSGALRPLVVMSFSLVLMRIETVAFLLVGSSACPRQKNISSVFTPGVQRNKFYPLLNTQKEIVSLFFIGLWEVLKKSSGQLSLVVGLV